MISVAYYDGAVGKFDCCLRREAGIIWDTMAQPYLSHWEIGSANKTFQSLMYKL